MSASDRRVKGRLGSAAEVNVKIGMEGARQVTGRVHRAPRSRVEHSNARQIGDELFP
jgi:hypothetical protein